MPSVSEQSKSRKGLDALDPDLSLLATEAAIDLDNILLNKNKDLSVIHRLAEQLKNTAGAASPQRTRRSLMDASTLSVLREAMIGAPGSKPMHQMDDIFDLAAEMADLLSSDDLVQDPEKQEKAKNFCLALSSAAIGYLRSVYDPSDTHPFER